MDIRDLRPEDDEGFSPPPTHLPPLTGQHVAGARSWTGLTYAILYGHRYLTLDVHVPEGVERPPLVVWIHGGGWNEGDRRYLPLWWPQQSLFEKVVAAGMAVATVDYRHLGEAHFPACVHDVHAAVRYLVRYADTLGVDASRLGLWGESAGGHLACLASYAPVRAARGEVVDGVELVGQVGVDGPQPVPDALVSWYTPNEQFHDFLAAQGERVADPAIVPALLPVSQIGPGAPPTLVVHGSVDQVVSVDDAHQIHDALVAAGVETELTIVDDADHCFVGRPIGPILDEAVAFLARHLLAGEGHTR
ncbi:lipase/esterase, putative [Serinicoccus hydrothermalis]|uniref:Lipase/esterase, putative n=1 Tax=Serinicoccus hydrothermalis TaxID=1758689 RepID=A0A1B1NF99_9MICO|nr:alpha/beta hydrolase [Serinicoccus hydrothermalis]ANS80111.1 lipase/esterase, putative [Serinicoccus hydrothermalis]